MYSEALVLPHELVKVVLEQDVLWIHVCEKQIHLSLVAALAPSEDGTDDLQHGRDTGSASDHTKVPDHVGCVDHGALGTLDLHSVTNLEGCKVLADVASGVRLDEEVEEAGVIVGRDGSVRAHDLARLSLLGLGVGHVEGRGERDMLSDGQAEDGVLGGELEAIDSSVMREDSLL